MKRPNARRLLESLRSARQEVQAQCEQVIEAAAQEPVNENLHKWFKEKWVRFGPDGKIRGDCARGDDSEGKPKCLPQSKAHSLGKAGRKYAAAKKRREDPNPERSGAAINVATKKKTSESKLDEKCWDTHRQAGMKRKGDRMVPNCVPRESQEQCPECGGKMYPDTMILEKQDACYYKVKSRYKVWPSAYASGALVQCRKKGAKNWGNKTEGVAEGMSWSALDEGLSVEDKIIIFEEYMTKGNLTESLDHDKEFIVETAEEIRELESLSGMIADKVMPIFSKSQRDYARIIKLKYLNLPQFKSPAVNDIIANASISMYRWWPGDTLGSWHNIEQNVTMRKDMLDNRNKFVSTLAHELTHALDDYKGLPRQYSKMTTKSKATAGDEYENYLRLQYEIDARLTQALLEIGSNIKELQDIDQLFSAPGEPTPKEQQVLSNAISWAFGKHQIAKLFPQGARDPKYRRLLTRAYKFYSTPAVAPQATEPTLVQRAKNWIGLNVLAEDANPARQAAKAIWNKKHHKKPKGVAEAHPNQQIALYKPDGTTYRGTANKMPTLDPEDPAHNAIRFGPEHDSSYEQDFNKEGLKRAAAKAIASLPKIEQQIIKLHMWHGVSLDEIGKRLGVSMSRVRQIEAKALSKLRASSDLKSFAEQDSKKTMTNPQPTQGEWDAMVRRIGQRAKAGTMVTVRDPETGRTRNIPVKPKQS